MIHHVDGTVLFGVDELTTLLSNSNSNSNSSPHRKFNQSIKVDFMWLYKRSPATKLTDICVVGTYSTKRYEFERFM